MVGVPPNNSGGDGGLRDERLVPVEFNEALLAKYEHLMCGVMSSLGFKKVSHSSHNGMVWEDAMQCARIGLWKATLDFDGEKVNAAVKDKFAFWAAVHIRNEIRNEWRRCQWMKWSKHHQPYIVLNGDDHVDVESWARVDDAVDAQREWDKILEVVKGFKPLYRNIFQGVMCDDGAGKSGSGGEFAQREGFTHQTLSDKRARIRKKLKIEKELIIENRASRDRTRFH
jgi:RNA polymerase sigma factor (sigma-70 family)